MLHAAAARARKSQVNGTKGPSRHDRAKINQRTSLTSHNARSRRSAAFSWVFANKG
jgi:hypothetical protein